MTLGKLFNLFEFQFFHEDNNTMCEGPAKLSFSHSSRMHKRIILQVSLEASPSGLWFSRRCLWNPETFAESRVECRAWSGCVLLTLLSDANALPAFHPRPPPSCIWIVLIKAKSPMWHVESGLPPWAAARRAFLWVRKGSSDACLCLCVCWKCWQQFPGKELETVSEGEVGQPLFWLLGVCQRGGGAGVDGMTLAWAPFHSLLLSTSSVSSAPGGGWAEMSIRSTPLTGPPCTPPCTSPHCPAVCCGSHQPAACCQVTLERWLVPLKTETFHFIYF